MFRKDSAKRIVSTFLEKSGFVCGSIKDTLSEKENIDWIKSSTKHMAGHIAQRACHADNRDLQSSPDTVEGPVFFHEDVSMEEEGSMGIVSTVGGETSAEEDTYENSLKKSSRFAKIIERTKKIDNDETSSSSGVVAAQSGAHTLVIGMCLSRRDVALGHPDTVTRQTAFDFNELQDRDYNFVSSTDPSGWHAGGGEKGGANSVANRTIAAPDTVHIPIIQINAENTAVVDKIISALARGEVFIPHMAILPAGLSVNGSSPPDLVVRFDCEKNDDTNPEDWPNWCLEFLHNQLYDLFAPMGAQWTKRPFQITLARKVKWKTVKHMNKFFTHAEQVVNTWREKGPQYLQPPESTGVTREEISRPHGIYLLRNGMPTNYFAPNFEPPYTTKVTRSLIKNVVNKSWDPKRRDWLLKPIPESIGPLKVISTVFGCADVDNGQLSPLDSNAVFDVTNELESFHITEKNRKAKSRSPRRKHQKETIESNAYAKAKEGVAAMTIPSDESFGTSSKPYGSASMESEMTESTADTLTQPSIESTTVSSTQYSKSTLASSSVTSSNDDREDQEFFTAPQRRSPKYATSTQKREAVMTVESDNHRYNEHYIPNSHAKIESARVEKFAKTKPKRQEMRERRQDDNTPASDWSPRTTKPLSPTESTSMSLAYSVEDSSFLHPSTSPKHIHNSDVGSVVTMGTENQSLLSYVTRSTMVHSKFEFPSNNDDDDDISLSLLESSSGIVPSDEELLTIGWAKALDPNSGVYYYFTLDRSQTVWENPLATSP